MEDVGVVSSSVVGDAEDCGWESEAVEDDGDKEDDEEEELEVEEATNGA